MKIFRTGSYENLYDLPIAINWGFTTQCNYRCSYCFDYGVHRGGVRTYVKYRFPLWNN